MPVALAKAHDLVLDRRAVARPAAFDLARIHWRAVDIGPDEVVRRRGRAGNGAFDLPVGDAVRHHGKGLRRIVAGLHLQRPPIDGTAIETRRRPRLEPTKRKSGPLKGAGETERRGLADAAGGNLPLADMDRAAQESARGQHHSSSSEGAAIRKPNASHLAFAREVIDLTFDHRQIWREPNSLLHRFRIKLAVSLRPRATNGRPLAAVEQAKLDAAGVGDLPHQTIEGVDLTDQMAFAETPDRRIARHRPDGGKALGE